VCFGNATRDLLQQLLASGDLASLRGDFNGYLDASIDYLLQETEASCHHVEDDDSPGCAQSANNQKLCLGERVHARL